MSQRLPNLVDPWRLADLGRRFAGRIESERLPRLHQAVVEAGAEIEYELEFFRDEQCRPCVTGSVEAQLKLECQRCLQPLEYPVRADISLILVGSIAEMEHLPDRYDPLLAEEGGTVSPVDLIEDELLLVLPQIAMHDPRRCAAAQPRQEEESPDGERESPFAPLARLKENLKTRSD